MSVHYKFKSALEYDTVTFDGLHISVKDLKKAIIHQKRIGKNTDFDLQVTNAQTKEGKVNSNPLKPKKFTNYLILVYSDENALIPKNTSLVIARIPMVAQTKGKPWEGYGNQGPAGAGGPARPEDGALSKAVDLTQLDASEDDKIRAMMTQSTLDYDPSKYVRLFSLHALYY